MFFRSAAIVCRRIQKQVLSLKSNIARIERAAEASKVFEKQITGVASGRRVDSSTVAADLLVCRYSRCILHTSLGM